MPRTMRRKGAMPRGATPGNQNAVKDNQRAVKDSFMAIRCRRSDKAAWITAANKEHKSGELTGLPHGNDSVLATWVIKHLNEAADRENDPAVTAKRRASELAAAAK